MQLLGTSKAYADYKKLTNDEIVQKIMKMMKAELNPLTMQCYERNVALLVSAIIILRCQILRLLQRKFICEEPAKALPRGNYIQTLKHGRRRNMEKVHQRRTGMVY